jgi:hypothetical protein
MEVLDPLVEGRRQRPRVGGESRADAGLGEGADAGNAETGGNRAQQELATIDPARLELLKRFLLSEVVLFFPY